MGTRFGLPTSSTGRLLARIGGGQLAVSGESHEVAFHAPDTLDRLPMVDSIRLRVTDYLSGDTPVIR